MIKKPEKIDWIKHYNNEKLLNPFSHGEVRAYNKAIEEYDKWLKDKCSVSQLEILILKMGTITRQGLTTSVVSVSSKDLATALHDYLLEREGK